MTPSNRYLLDTSVLVAALLKGSPTVMHEGAEAVVAHERTREMNLFDVLGGHEGCYRLASAFYVRVEHDPVLRPLYPPHITECPLNALAGFLAQFLGGPYVYGDRRWSMSLRAAHQRFAIGPREQAAWLTVMFQAFDDIQVPEPARSTLRWVFIQASATLVNRPPHSANVEALPEDLRQAEQHVLEGSPLQQEIAFRWEAHQAMEEAIVAIQHQEADQALRLLESHVLQDLFARDRAAWLNPLALLSKSNHPVLLDYVEQQLRRDPSLAVTHYMGDRTLLHEIAGQGNARIVAALLQTGADPNATYYYGKTPLYAISNDYPFDDDTGAVVVSLLARAGANVDAREKIRQCTALHMAARRGNVRVAQALLEHGADLEARDKYGDTPLHRAVRCGQPEMVAFLLLRGANAHAKGKSGQTPQQIARGERMRQVLQAGQEIR